MKLNLVADYDVHGKKHVATFAIHDSNNLVRLRELCTLNFPVRGEWKIIPPTSLTMCESKREAEAVAAVWRENYKADGRLYDFSSRTEGRADA